MTEVKVTTLGAARSNGKSCILVHVSGRLVMLDCGIDPSEVPPKSSGARTRYFPNFSRIGDINQVSCIIITHCHIDHVGALPYVTEKLGYDGPIYMTAATKKLSESVLEESIKQTNRTGNSSPVSLADVVSCLEKVTIKNFNESWKLPFDDALVFTLGRAGHVLGSATVTVVGEKTVFYTGDYGSVDDRVVGKLSIPREFPGSSSKALDVLITETTFCNTIRKSRIEGLAKLVESVHRCVLRGGKVVIPLAVTSGRLQEFLLELNEYFEANGIEAKIYYFTPFGKRLNEVYREYPRSSDYFREDFDFLDFSKLSRVSYWPHSYNDTESKVGMMKESFVVLAPDANLEHGLSNILFRSLCEDSNNLILFPGNSLAGTLGYRLINATLSLEGSRRVTVGENKISVKAEVVVLDSFSNHTDAKGILDLIEATRPKTVILVHGEEKQMLNFVRVIKKFGLTETVYCPKLNETKVCS